MATIGKKMSTNELLTNMRSGDKDFRYMAVSDMIDSLKKGLTKLEQSKQKELAEALLKLLGDINSEVRNLSVICIGELASTLRSEELAYIVGALMKNMDETKGDLDEVSSLAMKGVASAISPQNAVYHFNPLVPKLCNLLESQNPQAISVDMEILETLALLLPKLGKSVTEEALKGVERVALKLLETGKFQQRGRALLEALIRVLPDAEFERLVAKKFLMRLEPEQKKDVRVTARFVMAVGCACRADRQRFASLMDKFVPQLVDLCKTTGEQCEELIEASLQALESFVARCPRRMRAHKDEVARIACEMISYDPFFEPDEMEVDGEEEGGEHAENAMDVDDQEGEDSSDAQQDTSDETGIESDDEQDDDDDEGDLSWRVRRAASKCLDAVVTTQANEIESNLQALCPLLIHRLTLERNDLVKLSVLDLCGAIIKQLEEEVDLTDSVLSKKEESLLAQFKTQFPALLRALNSLFHKSRKDRKVVEASLQLLARSISFVDLSPAQSNKLQKSCRSIIDEETSHGEVKAQATKLLNAIAASNEPKKEKAAKQSGCDLSPSFILGLKSGLKSEDPKVRSKSITAYRSLLTGPQAHTGHKCLVDDALPDFLAEIGDPELEVKRCGILTLNSALQSRPKRMREVLPTVVSLLYAETKVKPELIREIEMGPFKTSVDDGLELRKSAYECMYTLGDKQFKHIDVSAFLDTLQGALLADSNCDIRKLVLLILSHACVKCPNDVSDKLDSLSDAIKNLLTAQMGKNPLPGEAEKLVDVKRSALSTYAALKKVPFASESSKMAELCNVIDSDPVLRDLLKALDTPRSAVEIHAD